MSAMKNTRELRETLAEEIENLRNGDEKSTPAKVNAIARSCSVMLSSCAKDLEYARLHGKKKKITFLE